MSNINGKHTGEARYWYQKLNKAEREEIDNMRLTDFDLINKIRFELKLEIERKEKERERTDEEINESWQKLLKTKLISKPYFR